MLKISKRKIDNFFQQKQFRSLLLNQIRSSVHNLHERQRNVIVNDGKEENTDESSKTNEYCEGYSALIVP